MVQTPTQPPVPNMDVLGEPPPVFPLDTKDMDAEVCWGVGAATNAGRALHVVHFTPKVSMQDLPFEHCTLKWVH